MNYKLGNSIKEHIRSSDFNLSQLSRQTGISRVTFERWLSQDNINAREGLIQKVAEVLGLVSETDGATIEFRNPKQEATLPRKMSPPGGVIPVVGMASAGIGIDSVDDYPQGEADMYVNRPHGLTDQNAYGILIEGNSMYPAFKPHQIVIVSPDLEPHSKDRCIFRLNNGDVIIGELKENGDSIEIIKYNSDNITIAKKDLKFIHKICWVKEL
jgi:phage repressor protein C with HTH and peptisase S24 domain